MIIETFTELFDRDIEKLHKEISLYGHESNLWKVDKAIPNSAGNLCLHLVGNLNTFIGRELGGTPYIRKRDEEFSLKNIPKEELLRMADDTRQRVKQALTGFPEVRLSEIYPPEVFNQNVTVYHFLVHLLAHLSYHTGQINYHRRLLDSE